MSELTESKNYLQTLDIIKEQVKSAQIKAHLSVNKEMLILYWQIGKTIVDKQKQEGWGTKITRKLSEDLTKTFPHMKGFSYTNINYMLKFARAYEDLLIFQAPLGKLAGDENVQQIVAQTDDSTICPQVVEKLEEKINGSQKKIFYSDYSNIIFGITWYHNITLLDKVKDKEQRLWYAQQTIENGWSRNVLVHQISTNLYKRKADKTIKSNNFKHTLPLEQSEVLQEVIKDEYNLDFIENADSLIAERKLERSLIENIEKFLLELGKGFAFVGKQYHLEAYGDDYYIDLLFYHLELRSFIVLELKTTKFKPEYAGKMALYLAQVDKKLKKDTDNNSIGIILCTGSNKEMEEDVLQYITKPMGVSQYKIAEDKKELPEELKPIEDLKKLIK